MCFIFVLVGSLSRSSTVPLFSGFLAQCCQSTADMSVSLALFLSPSPLPRRKAPCDLTLFNKGGDSANWFQETNRAMRGQEFKIPSLLRPRSCACGCRAMVRADRECCAPKCACLRYPRGPGSGEGEGLARANLDARSTSKRPRERRKSLQLDAVRAKAQRTFCRLQSWIGTRFAVP